MISGALRAIAAAGLALVVTLSVIYDGYLARRMFGELHMNDFGRFYYSARAFLEGADMYGPTVATPIRVGTATAQLWNMNPPQFHLLILPIAWLEPLGAVVVWALLNAVALLISLALIARELRIDWTFSRVLWTAVALALSAVTSIIIVTGQVTCLLMLPVTVAWVDARRGKWRRAGAWLGFAAALKPFLGLFAVYFLVARRFRATAAMALGAVVSMAAGLVVFGPESFRRWLEVLGTVDWGFAPMNASMHGILSRTFAPNPVFAMLHQAPGLVTPLATAAALAVGVVTVWAIPKDSEPTSVDLAFGGLILASLLASPLGWIYYLWLGLGPLTGVTLSSNIRLSEWSGRPSGRPLRAGLKAGPSIRRACLAVAAVGLVLPLYMTTVLADRPIGGITLGSAYGWTVLGLWLWVILECTKRHFPSQKPPHVRGVPGPLLGHSGKKRSSLS